MKRIFLVLALVALAGAAHAQTADIFHNSGGTSYNNPLTTLRVLGSGQDETRDLTIEAREWPATVSFRVGEGSGCGRSGGRWGKRELDPGPKNPAGRLPQCERQIHRRHEHRHGLPTL